MKRNNKGFASLYQVIVIVVFTSVIFIAGMYAWNQYTIINLDNSNGQQTSSESDQQWYNEYYLSPNEKFICVTDICISTEGYECIDKVDCMPIVPPENQKYCNKTYIEWAKLKCPGFQVSY